MNYIFGVYLTLLFGSFHLNGLSVEFHLIQNNSVRKNHLRYSKLKDSLIKENNETPNLLQHREIVFYKPVRIWCTDIVLNFQLPLASSDFVHFGTSACTQTWVLQCCAAIIPQSEIPGSTSLSFEHPSEDLLQTHILELPFSSSRPNKPWRRRRRRRRGESTVTLSRAEQIGCSTGAFQTLSRGWFHQSPPGC